MSSEHAAVVGPTLAILLISAICTALKGRMIVRVSIIAHTASATTSISATYFASSAAKVDSRNLALKVGNGGTKGCDVCVG